MIIYSVRCSFYITQWSHVYKFMTFDYTGTQTTGPTVTSRTVLRILLCLFFSYNTNSWNFYFCMLLCNINYLLDPFTSWPHSHTRELATSLGINKMALASTV